MEESKQNKYKFQGSGLGTSERRQAEERFIEYQTSYHIEKLADFQLLEELVFRESLQERYKTTIGDLVKKAKKVELTTTIPKAMLNALNDNLEQILILKDKLGLFDEKEKSDFYTFWERYKKKMQIYAETHGAECTFKCPSCGEYALLLLKVDDYNTFNFNLLRGTFVYNKELMEEIEKGTLSEDRVAEILGCSVDYIKGCYNDIYLKEKKQDNR